MNSNLNILGLINKLIIIWELSDLRSMHKSISLYLSPPSPPAEKKNVSVKLGSRNLM